MLKDFISKQTAFKKSVEEKFGKIDVVASKVDCLALDVELLKLKVLPRDVKESKTLNAIQVKIDDNVRMLVELHARWEREDEIARNMTKICIITTTSDVVSNAITSYFDWCKRKSLLLVLNCLKLWKLFLIKVLKFFRVWETIVLLLLIVMILMLMVAIFLK
jgi:hypothetical protein